jgi:hypothetical protein
MTAYAIMTGTRYLQTTLFEPMQKLSSIADIQSPELDPNRMTDQSDLAISRDVLQLLSRLIFTSLQKSIPSVPMYEGGEIELLFVLFLLFFFVFFFFVCLFVANFFHSANCKWYAA